MEITEVITRCIRNKTPVSFSKYGDGEYACMKLFKGHNCDSDFYTEKKQFALIQSLIYMVDNAPNSYISYWTNEISSYMQSLMQTPIRWGKVHTLIMDDDSINEKVELYKAIKHSPLKKIYICNPLMAKAESLLNIDFMVHIPINNWFDTSFEKIIDTLKTIIHPDEQYIVMCSAGMGSKVVICELVKLFPNNIYLDIGSALDTICTKLVTRDHNRTYEKALYYLRDIVPNDWNDPKYDKIYETAKKIWVFI
jgi:hypothetical protein